MDSSSRKNNNHYRDQPKRLGGFRKCLVWRLALIPMLVFLFATPSFAFKAPVTVSTMPTNSSSALHFPVAAFTYSPCTVCLVPGDLVSFNASYSVSIAASITQYRWDFGDGSAPVQTNSPYTYHDYFGYPGRWAVTLTVSTSNGSTDTVSQLVVFDVAPRFTLHPSIGLVGRPVTFNASTSTSYGPKVAEYLWGFGDNTTGSGIVATHAYSMPGVYRVNLTLVTTEGNPTISKTIVVWKNPDVNGDGTIALDDLVAVWTHQFTNDPQYDLNGDGSCDITDLTFVFVNQFQTM